MDALKVAVLTNFQLTIIDQFTPNASVSAFMISATALLEEIGKTYSMLDVACSQAKQTLENLKQKVVAII